MRRNKSLRKVKFFEQSVKANEVKKKYKRKRYEPYKLYIPENLDIDKVLRESPPNFKSLPGNYSIYRDKFLYILHLINSIPNSKNDFDFEQSLGLTPVNKEFLRNRIHDYRCYLDYLVFEQKILIEGTKFKRSVYSKGLKFNKKYRVKVKPVIITCNSLIKSIVSNKNNKDSEKEYKLSFLLKWFCKDLKIDFDSAIKFIDDDKPNAVAKAIKKRQNRKYKKSFELLLPSIDEVVESGNISKKFTITQINEVDYNHKLHFDLTTGRFHTPLTRLKKELRKFVSYKNERLVNIDITNSQPLLSLIILDIDIFLKLNIRSLISNYNPSYKEIVNYEEVTHNPYYTKLVNLIIEGSNKPDIIEYKKAVIAGNYYERFGEILLEHGLIPDDILEISDIDLRYKAIRKYAKIATFQSFFDTRRAHIYNPIVKAFKSCFPNVYEIFQQVKLGKREVVKNGHLVRESTYNTLACVLQRFESFLVLEKTCSEVNLINSEIPIFTIHDSVITTEKNYKKVKQIFAKNIFDLIGINPKLQREEW